MKRILGFLAGLILTIPMISPAHAQVGGAIGGTYDLVKLSKGGEYVDLAVTFLPALWYHLGLNDNGPLDENGFPTATEGLTIGFRGTDDESTIQQWSLGYWDADGPIEWFVDALLEAWDESLTGNRELLVGGRAGIRGQAIGVQLPVELAVAYRIGQDGIEHPSVSISLYGSFE